VEVFDGVEEEGTGVEDLDEEPVESSTKSSSVGLEVEVDMVIEKKRR
jgi:hypothetical protein